MSLFWAQKLVTYMSVIRPTYMSLVFVWHICQSETRQICHTSTCDRSENQANDTYAAKNDEYFMTYMSLKKQWHICHHDTHGWVLENGGEEASQISTPPVGLLGLLNNGIAVRHLRRLFWRGHAAWTTRNRKMRWPGAMMGLKRQVNSAKSPAKFYPQGGLIPEMFF